MTKKDSLVEKVIVETAANVILLDVRRNAMNMVFDTFQKVLANQPKVELTELDYAAIDQSAHVESCQERWEDCELCNMDPQEWLEHFQRLDAEEGA